VEEQGLLSLQINLHLSKIQQNEVLTQISDEGRKLLNFVDCVPSEVPRRRGKREMLGSWDPEDLRWELP